MNIKIAAMSNGAHEHAYSAVQKKREEWQKYYERGYRLCRVAYQDVTRIMFLADKPIISERLLVLKFEPTAFVEIWSGIDKELGSAYVKISGKVFYGGKVNGWSLKPCTDIPHCDFRPASSEAMRSLKLFKAVEALAWCAKPEQPELIP
jgi:hypothetical protein